LAVLLAGCPQRPDESAWSQVPTADDPVLQIADIDVTAGELDRFVPYIRGVDPALSKAFIRRTVLKDFWLLGAVVRAVASKERVAQARRRAENVATAVAQAGGTVDALRRIGAQYGGEESGDYLSPLNSLAADALEQVFTIAVGQTTGAIHSVWGSAVLGVVDERRRTVLQRKIYTVHFPYLATETTKSEVLTALDALLGAEAWVHPLYRDDLGSLFPILRPDPLRELHRKPKKP
jgi:hypothetical protein